jgi:hypothetical protein
MCRELTRSENRDLHAKPHFEFRNELRTAAQIAPFARKFRAIAGVNGYAPRRAVRNTTEIFGARVSDLSDGVPAICSRKVALSSARLIAPPALGQRALMSECGQRAVLVVTRSVEGTATNVARRRVELRCNRPEQHAGPHQDSEHGEQWQGAPGQVSTILRDETEEPTRE